MAADVINLRQARKARARAEKVQQAAENRAAFGRKKSEHEVSGAARRLQADRLEQHRRTRTDGGGDGGPDGE